MKFKGSFSSVGVNWLERFVPIFDKLGKELSVLLTPNTLHLIQGHTVSGGLELHADLLQEEVFDEYKISSNNGDKIAFKLDPAVLYRVLRGLIGSEATHIEVKLIKRVVAPERSLPFLNFNSKGMVDIVQDVPLAGPLNRREIEDCEALVQANVVNVPYWLNLDRTATEGAHQAVERFRAVGLRVELATTRAGSLHLTTSKGGAVTLGTEYRGVSVLPVSEDEGAGGGGDVRGGVSGGRSRGRAGDGGDSGDGERQSASERLAEVKASGGAAVVNVNTKQLWKGLIGVGSNPSNCLVGVAANEGHVELVYRYERQAVNGADAVGLMVRLPVEEDDDVHFD